MLVPPILSLIDDAATDNKVKGCEMLTILLKITPPTLLERTGLGKIFSDALIPSLSYLPALTSETESVQLLSSVYPVLLQLTRTRYSQERLDHERIRFLDKLVRVGIIGGLRHAGEYVQLATFLICTLNDLVNEMGIWSVKHLKVS